MPIKLAGAGATLLVLLAGWGPPAGATNSTTSDEFCYGADGDCLPPDEWPDVCVSGNSGRQSPVDIHDSERAALPRLNFAYGRVPLTVETNGHTLEVVYESTTPDHLSVGDRTCQLQQFHFHHTAEHPLGGTVYPMEAHLVHNCGPNDLLVVGVLLHYLKDKPNPALATALEHAPRDGDRFVKDEVEVPGVLVDASDLLPSNRSYFTYGGSLTTPPCSETVSWYVLKTPVAISKEQVDEFTRLLEDTSPNGFPFNNRPTQPLNDRSISQKGRPSLD
jgi:carbonic anhydrase